MRAVNHGLTGAAIAVVIKQPLLAMPLAFASHFVCDFLPHSGLPNEKIKSRNFWVLLAVDATLAVACTLAIAIVWHQLWWLVIVCAFLAASPDLAWFYYKVLHSRKRLDIFTKFHQAIQWYQKPAGFLIEALWFVGFFAILIVAGI